MNAVQNDHFDSTTARAWGTFTENLHAHLRSLPMRDYITVTAAQASPGERGLRPYIDIAATRDGALVSIASLPSLLYPEAPESVTLDVQLLDFGWLDRGKPVADGSIIDLTRTDSRADAALVAEMVTRAFRELWNVPHPSFLSVWGVAADGAASGPIDLQRGIVGVRSSTAQDGSADSTPTDPPSDIPDELRSLHTLCQLTGRKVDAQTVHSVCVGADIDELGVHALALHRSAAAHSDRSAAEGTGTSIAVWTGLARTWLLVARSIAAAAGSDRHACR
ncbi:hypothetical protein HQO84_14960 [Rhodococcus fascians]|nr:hypothetical protein [Rhodococcus fascians]MBY3996204.1 hypothetical protein [Rhodococcus fascians]MBY4003081.1 hypothetical protein [Rhodococcus fascians]MBY4007831.1 hypothetical protein [Rhodococcus fascians]MBY4017416.1 hypothetical protein [Rhodococcus fascians]